MTQTTQELKTKLEELVQTYNEAVQTQNKAKEAFIAIQAVIQDREDGDTDNNSAINAED